MGNKFLACDIRIKNELRHVEIDWADGHKSVLPIERLRGYCPCAECQGHQNPIRYHENRTKAINSASTVGRYAIQFQFADGHSTGIFRYEWLRELDSESYACST